MAAKYWLGTGAVPAALADNDNWSPVNNPVSDDEMHFLSLGVGTRPSDEMDDLTAVDADLIYVGPLWGVDIGGTGSGNAGHMQISADKVDIKSYAGTTYYTDGDGTTDWVVLDSTASAPLDHNCFSLGGGTVSHLDCLRGKGTIENGATLTQFICGYRNPGSTESKLVLSTGSTVTTGLQYGGIVEANVAVATSEVWGGVWTQIAGLPTTLRCMGGQYIHKITGTITTLIAGAGANLDFTQSNGVVTVTTLHKHPTATIKGWTPDNNGILIATNTRAIY